MDAILLVGGQGTRLRPLTAHRHKSLVPIANRAAIDHLISWLGRGGVDRVILALGVQNEDLAAACPPGRVHGVELVHVVERERLESGGAIRNAVAEARISSRFVVVNGDIYVDFDLQRMLAQHESESAELSIALAPVEDPSPFGVAAIEHGGWVTRFVEKPQSNAPSNLANAGVWVFEPEVAAEILPGALRIEETLFPTLVSQKRRVLGHPAEGLWADVGTPARYLAINVELARAGGGRIVDTTAATNRATVVDSVVGARTQIGAGSQIRSSVVWEQVLVGANATITESVLADGVEVGEDASVTGTVAGQGATIESGAVVPPGTVLAPGERYHRVHGS